MTCTVRNGVASSRPATSAVLIISSLIGIAAPASGLEIIDLFISEYVEGSSSNQAIELYNGTGGAVDLGDFKLEIYFGGSTTVGNTITLVGTVADGEVHVVANSLADSAVLTAAHQTSPDVSFNGDDAVVLRKGAVVIDAIGQVGNDPGEEWSGGGIGTRDETLRRQGSICAGDMDSSDAFDPSTEWEGFSQDTFDGLGSHSIGAVTLSDDTLLSTLEVDVCGPIVVGPNYVVHGPDGHLILRTTGAVTLTNGAAVAVDGRLTVEDG